MNTVWIFGDSFSVDYDKNPIGSFKEYIKLKGYSPKTYGKLISEHYNMDYKNYSRGGWDNYSILESFCNNLYNIKDGDIVFLGWSNQSRFRIVYEDIWVSINGSSDCYENISRNTMDEILVNRTHPYYKREIESWNKLIKYSLKPHPNVKLIVWEWSSYEYNGKFDTITNETKSQICDFHWSEEGHKQFTEQMIPIINGT